ncbi:MAG: T9SS type A sorting domain-containing protein [Chlorobi bacterium]|nr:T9SS type A sorting domain-containing protein [Chlorobiota bacterium]
MKTFLPGLLLLLLFSSSGFAQISLTRADMEKFLSAKSMTSYEATDVEGKTFNVGTTGQGNTYDYTGFTFDKNSQRFETVVPSSTPYANEFPKATHAQRIVTTGSEVYLYSRLDNTGWYSLGIAGDASGQAILLKYDPERPEFLFPVKLGASWSYDGKPSEIAPGASTQTRSQTTVDAAGTLVLPNGSFDCLRLKKVEWNSTKVEAGGQVVFSQVKKTVSYSFITLTNVSADLDIDTLDENSTTPKLHGASYLTWSSTPTSVSASDAARAFSLGQNFPNPVSSESDFMTTVTLDGELQHPASFELYNIYGERVSTFSRSFVAGNGRTILLDMRGLESGSYILVVRSGDRAAAKRIPVVK